LESIRENIKISAKDNVGYHRVKHNKPWFENECSKLIDELKQSKLQWLHNPSQINGNNLHFILRSENSRIFRKQKRKYRKGKINVLEINRNKKHITDLYRGKNEFKKL
jgi:hypothetical protein